MLERVGSALDAAKNVDPLDVLTVGCATAAVLVTANNGVTLYRSLFSATPAHAQDFLAINEQRESALNTYKAAQTEINSDSLGSVLATINVSISDYERALSRVPGAIEFDTHKSVLAKLYYSRSQVLALQGESHHALKSALIAAKYKPSFILAHNLIAHLYLYQFHDADKAKAALAISMKLDEEQIYAKFCLAMLNNDPKAMDLTVEKIFHIYHHQIEFELSGREGAHADYRMLLNTTPFICLPHVLVSWLDIKIDHAMNDAALLTGVNAFNAILNSATMLTNTRLRRMMTECLISALFKLSKMYPHRHNLTEHEQALRANCAVMLTARNEAKFYLAHSGEHLDSTFTKLFPKGRETSYLFHEKYRARMGKIIDAWARQGLLNDDEHPLLQSLLSLLNNPQLTKSDKARLTEVSALTEQDEMIHHFIHHHINNKGWQPWLTATSGEQVLSLLSLACEEQGIDLIVHPISHDHDDLALNSDRFLHVFHDRDETASSFKLLREINHPSELYHCMALMQCWQLLKDDTYNAVAWSMLGECGYAALPAFAATKLADPKTPASAKKSLIHALEAFIQHHDGTDQRDKEFATAILDRYTASKRQPSYLNFFTTKAVIGASVAIAASLGVAYALKRN